MPGAPPFPATRDFAPVGSMSLDSRVAGLPYESSSFATSRGNESVTGFTFSVIWQNNHSADWLAALASPYPAAPDFPPKGETTHYDLCIAGASSSSAVTDSLDFQVADAPLQIQFA